MAYNEQKLRDLIKQHRELSASIQIFNKMRESARVAHQRQRTLLIEADNKMWRTIESKHLKPLSEMPLDEILEAWHDFHPARTHLAKGTIEEYIEFATDLRDIESQLNEMTGKFGSVDRTVSACIEFLESKN